MAVAGQVDAAARLGDDGDLAVLDRHLTLLLLLLDRGLTTRDLPLIAGGLILVAGARDTLLLIGIITGLCTGEAGGVDRVVTGPAGHRGELVDKQCGVVVAGTAGGERGTVRHEHVLAVHVGQPVAHGHGGVVACPPVVGVGLGCRSRHEDGGGGENGAGDDPGKRLFNVCIPSMRQH